MKIKIITTEKKLTLNILKQMFELSYKNFDNVEVLGFVTIESKTSYRNALCYKDNEYYLLNMHWERRGHYAGYNGKRCEYQKKLDKEIIDDWFEKYNKLINEAKKKGHIYV